MASSSAPAGETPHTQQDNDEEYEEDEVTVDLQHQKSSRRKLHDLYNSHLFCDVVLVTEHKKFQCHKNVLAAGCEYFYRMFTSGMKETFVQEIVLRDVKPHILELLLGYLYTSEIVLTENNVKDVLMQANFFQLNSLEDKCVQYIKNAMTTSNCLEFLVFSERYPEMKLKNRILLFVCENYSSIMEEEEEEAVLLSGEVVIDILTHSYLKCNGEENVFKFVAKWLEKNPDDYERYSYGLLQCVKFPLLSPEFVKDVVTKSDIRYRSPSIGDAGEVRSLVDPTTGQLQFDTTNGYQSEPRADQEVIFFLDRNTRNPKCGLFSADLKVVVPVSIPDDLCMEHTLNSVCSIGSDVYVIVGGDALGYYDKQIWVYHALTDTWSRAPDMIHGVEGYFMAAIDNSVYVLSGDVGDVDDNPADILGVIQKYNPDENRWVDVPCEIPCYNWQCCVPYGRRIYMYGYESYSSNDGNIREDKLAYYSIDDNTFTMVDTTFPSCSSNSVRAIAMRDQIYFFVTCKDGHSLLFEFDPSTEMMVVFENYPDIGICGISEFNDREILFLIRGSILGKHGWIEMASFPFSKDINVTQVRTNCNIFSRAVQAHADDPSSYNRENLGL